MLGLTAKKKCCLVDSKEGEITYLCFNKLMMAAGHTNGVVNIFDNRFSKILFNITHKNRLPVKAVTFLNEFLLSADPKAMEISKSGSGDIVTTIESIDSINDIECVNDSGMVFMANEVKGRDLIYPIIQTSS